MGGVQYAIISCYGLHIGHNRTDIQRPVADSLVLYIVIVIELKTHYEIKIMKDICY